MFKVDISKLSDDELKEYWKTISKCFESDELASMPGEKLEETEIYIEAMCVQTAFTERGLPLPK